MLTTLLVLQIIVAVALVIIILLQKTSSDGLAGFSGGGQNSGDSLLSGRASANLLTRTTAILAIVFIVNCLAMATIIARSDSFAERVLERERAQEELLKDTAPTSDEEPATPNVPIAE